MLSRSTGPGRDTEQSMLVVPPKAVKSQIYLWTDRMMFAGDGYQSRPHRHLAATMLVAVHPEHRVGVQIGPGPAQFYSAVLIAPGQAFAVHAPKVPLLTFNIERDSAAFTLAMRALGGRIITAVDRTQMRWLQSAFEQIRCGSLSFADAGGLFDELLDRAAYRLEAPPPSTLTDPRLRDVIAHMRMECPRVLPVAALAKDVGLSSSRLMHLFSQQMGAPLRRFMLWLRLRRGISLIDSRGSVTEVAQAAGFYDSAHYTHVVNAMYGVRPSMFSHHYIDMHQARPWLRVPPVTWSREALDDARWSEC